MNGQEQNPPIANFLPWLPIVVAGLVGILTYSYLDAQSFVRNTPNQYGQWILSVFLTGLAGTMIGLITLSYELRTVRMQPSVTIAVTVLIGAALACSGILAYTTVNATKPGQPDLLEDILLVGFAFASLIGVLLIVKRHENQRFWIARLVAVEVPATFAIALVVLAKHLIYEESTPYFSEWLYSQKLYLGKELAEKAKVHADATTALRDSFWVGVTFGVVGVQLVLSTVAATLLDLWRLGSARTTAATQHSSQKP